MIKGVPYDAEIAFLESYDGFQYIDTGLTGADLYQSGGFEIDCTPMTRQAYTPVANISNDRNFNFLGLNNSTTTIYSRYNDDQKTATASTFNIATFLGERIVQKALGLTYTIKCNGITVTGTYSQLCKNNSDHLCVFYGGNYSHAPYYWTAKFRVHGAKCWTDANTLVRDYIPVRVGSVGYLYDRVTRRLFGNAGTGAFTLGPDVATPVMSLHRMALPITAKSYVQDGLIAMWDGIENAGWGTHDANTTTWKNLGTLGDTADIFRSYVNWAQNSAIFERVTDRIEVFGSEMLPAAILGHTWSIEAVFKPNNSYYNNYSGVCGNHYNSSRSNRGIVMAQYEGGSCGIGSWAGNASYSTNLGQSSASSFLPVNTPTSLTMTASGLNGNFSLYKNGAFVNANSNIGDKCNITCAQPFLVGAAYGLTGRIYAPDRYFSGNIYAVRLSSRALTADEIAYNYNIDRLRFGIGGAS